MPGALRLSRYPAGAHAHRWWASPLATFSNIAVRHMIRHMIRHIIRCILRYTWPPLTLLMCKKRSWTISFCAVACHWSGNSVFVMLTMCVCDAVRSYLDLFLSAQVCHGSEEIVFVATNCCINALFYAICRQGGVRRGWSQAPPPTTIPCIPYRLGFRPQPPKNILVSLPHQPRTLEIFNLHQPRTGIFAWQAPKYAKNPRFSILQPQIK
jgi:hypothetical protein